MSPEREVVVERAFEQADQVMIDLKGADPKDRLAALRLVVALVEASEGKRTLVEHRYPERPGLLEESPVNS